LFGQIEGVPDYTAYPLTQRNAWKSPRFTYDDYRGAAKGSGAAIFGDWSRIQIRSQGYAASCFAFAVACHMEYGWYTRRFEEVRLSPIFIVGRYYGNDDPTGWRRDRTPWFNLQSMLYQIGRGGVPFEGCQDSYPDDAYAPVPNKEDDPECKRRMYYESRGIEMSAVFFRIAILVSRICITST
jgi:hypothetical protein